MGTPMGPPMPHMMMPPGGMSPEGMPMHPMDPLPRAPSVGGGPPYVTHPMESQYGTMRRGPMIEEPIYGGSVMASSYHPGNMPAEHDDAYMEQYHRQQQVGRGKKQRSASRASPEAQNSAETQYWDNFESGIYRRPMANERAFGASLTGNTREDSQQPEPPTGASYSLFDSLTRAVDRPATPPCDYDETPGSKRPVSKRPGSKQRTFGTVK